jgi:putative ABC transport system ATP-binding protein
MIELRGISKRYGDKIIFNQYSMHIKEGEMVAVVGKSGCGKSTLLNIIGLLETVDEGQVCIDDFQNIYPQSRLAITLIREKIGYLFQNFALVDEETVFYNLKLALKYVKGNKKQMIEKALTDVGLQGYENKKIYQLSGGEQQRVALARIMIKPSKIILADEPTGSLDAENRDVVMSMLRKLQQQGKTIVIVTHDNHVAAQCDRVISLAA